MDWFNDLGAVEWFREQFVDPTAWSIFRLMLMSWTVAAVVSIALDRLGGVLLGRSRPLAQEPPLRARAWRWGRTRPPENYSLLPAGTTVKSSVPRVATEVPLQRPLAALGPAQEDHGDDDDLYVELPDPSAPMDDKSFWALFAQEQTPIFGFENDIRLDNGEPPERYNPITEQIEVLERDVVAGTMLWSWQAEDPHVVGPD